MYRNEDLKTINRNLGKLEDKAKEIYITQYEPTIEENRKVYDIIKEYIKKNNLIIYGGYAQNSLIKKMNEKDAFYREIDLADIEFYSFDPLQDLINLCDILYSKKFKFVEGKEGAHCETYKIFVNFHNYLDISYLPKNIFNNCPTIINEGMRMTHPHFMLIDAYRVYTDPMTSYFRLNKTFSRFTKLMEYYPFNKNAIYNEFKFEIKLTETQYKEINSFILNNFLKKRKLIIMGFHAFNRLMTKAKMPDNYFIQEPYFEIISYNYNKDKEDIFNLLQKTFKDIKKKSYYKFSQFFDKSSEYYYKDQLILRLYGNNERCTVYKYSKKNNLYYGTLQLQILYLLIHYNIGKIRNNNFMQTFNISMITRLLKARDKYLEKSNKTILQKSPFQEFTFKCFGDPKDILRTSMLKMLENKKKGKQMKYAYRPTDKKGVKPEFYFENTTGDIIEKNKRSRNRNRNRK